MKRGYMIIALSLFAAMAFSVSSVAWEGRAAVGHEDAFPSGGRYAQSRVFTKGEIVEVYNTANGKSSTVVITGATDLAGVLILLSPSAATELGVSSGYDSVVRVSRKDDFVKENTLTGGNAAQDPDYSSVAALKNDLAYTETTPPKDFVPPLYVPEESAQNPVSQVKENSVSAYEYSLLPPSRSAMDEASYAQNVTEVEGAGNAQAQTAANEPKQVQVQSVIVKTPQIKIETDSAVITASSVVSPGTAQPKANDEAFAQSASVTQNNAATLMPFPELLINSYEKGKYYVQLGVYRNMTNLRNVVGKYRKAYPVSIKASGVKADGYEMLIGPLSKDEYAAVLDTFRKNGFKDSFVKSGK